ncbi:TrkA family potassium uptake protein [Natronomonas gomsonensis]|uniref:potassium channel family protein n=1 Tax=Natronomonas gomsonensis TaxID=1046043 RepID=UPI0015BAFC80|nr:NAD-binding protein [Natronomonas gomsonensis]
MDSWRHRTFYYLLGLLAVMFAYTLAYDYGMSAFENDPRTFLESFQIVVETFTTTGFGSDSAGWSSTEMLVLIVVMDLTGVLLIFIALPVLVFPLFEEAISTTAPTSVEDFEDHVVICNLTSRGETLIDELESNGVGYVVVEQDREVAEELHEAEYSVIHADPKTLDGLRAAELPSARALVADDTDQINTSIILTAKELAGDVEVISFAEDPSRERYHHLAGADTVFSPRALLGRSLASKITTSISTSLSDTIAAGDQFEIVELPIHHGSELIGKTIDEIGIRQRTGANVIGAWFRGQFETPPSPDAVIDSGTVLLVTGQEPQLERLKNLTLSDIRHFRSSQTLLIGRGEVGDSVASRLDEEGIPYTTLDLVEKPGVDRVGDATDPEELEAAGIQEANTAVLALSDDTTTEFATLVARDLSPDIEILARAEENENVTKIYRAGADYVLSLATVSGRMLASTILDEEVISFDKQVDIVQTEAPGLVGTTIGEAEVRSETNCTVIAVERNGDVRTEIGPDFRIEDGDELIIAGTDEGTSAFTERFG